MWQISDELQLPRLALPQVPQLRRTAAMNIDIFDIYWYWNTLNLLLARWDGFSMQFVCPRDVAFLILFSFRLQVAGFTVHMHYPLGGALRVLPLKSWQMTWCWSLGICASCVESRKYMELSTLHHPTRRGNTTRTNNNHFLACRLKPLKSPQWDIPRALCRHQASCFSPGSCKNFWNGAATSLPDIWDLLHWSRAEHGGHESAMNMMITQWIWGIPTVGGFWYDSKQVWPFVAA